MGLIKKLKENHMLMMLLCCLLPLLGILIARYFFGINNNYLVFVALLTCIGSHYFMMKGMNKGGKADGGGKIGSSDGKNSKSGGGCHN